MDKTFLQEAFDAMRLLEEEDFRLDDVGIKDILDFKEHDELNDIVDVYDPEAETEEEVKDTYIGDAILECEVCHSPIFKAIEDVIVDEDSDLANIEDECPICHSQDGFKIIGTVAPFETEPELKVEVEDKPEEDSEEVEETVEDEIEESLEAAVEITEELEEPTESLDESLEVTENIVEEITEELEEAKICEKCGKNPCECEKEELKEDTEEIEDTEIIEEPAEDSEATEEIEDTEEASAVVADAIVDVVDAIEAAVDAVSEEDVAIDATIEVQVGDEETEEVEESFKDETNEFSAQKVEDPEKDDTISEKPVVDEALQEGFEKIDLETEDKIIHVSEEEKPEIPDAEMITPISDEVEAEIMNPEEVEEIPEETFDDIDTPEVGADEEIDYDIDDFDESEFDDLGESYLKEVYENVESFKTSKVSLANDKLVVEGIIKFNSGKEKETQFIFEAKDATKDGKVRFIGENAQITKGKKAFTLSGQITENRFIAESLNYNYRAKNSDGKPARLYGTIRLNK